MYPVWSLEIFTSLQPGRVLAAVEQYIVDRPTSRPESPKYRSKSPFGPLVSTA